MPNESARRGFRNRHAAAAAIAALLVALSLFAGASGAATRHLGVRLDPSFGRSGWTKTPPGTAGEGRLVEVSVAPDGGPVVADLVEGRIIRLAPDGRLERRFGHHGRLSIGPSAFDGGHRGRTFVPTSIALDQAGRLVVFGQQSDPGRTVKVPGNIPEDVPSSFAIVSRFDRQGHRDPGFGGGKGYVRDDFGLHSPLSSQVPLVGAMNGIVDSQDRPVLLAGVTSSAGPCAQGGGIEEIPKALVRLTRAGAPDPAFGSGGVSPIEGTTRFPQLEIAGKGQLAVGAGPIGSTRVDCRNGDVIYRLGPNGERSGQFGSEGALSLERMRLSAMEPSGAVIVSRRQSGELLLSRFSPTGARDSGFGRAGTARVDLPAGPDVEISSVLVEKNGGILIVGFSMGRPSRREASSFFVARLSATGKVDLNVGAHGWVRTEFPRPLKLTSVQAKLDPRGRLVVAGTTAMPADPDGGFLVARYLTSSR